MPADLSFFLQVVDNDSELKFEDPSTINFYLAQALPYINFSLYKTKGNYAHALYAAHLMKMLSSSSIAGGGNGGAVTSTKVGDLQRSFGNNASGGSSSSSLSSTAYGKLFLELRKSISVSPLVIV